MLVIILWSAHLQAAPSTPATPVILVLGDSLSAGYGIGKEQSWPSLLARRLQEKRLPQRVVNISISGETTAGGRSRLAAALKEHRPQIVLLELGANDGLRGLPLEQMQDNLAAMIQLSQQQGARVLLIGMRLPPNYGADYETGFQQVYRQLAQRYRVPLQPFLFDGLAEQRSAFQADGLHPTAASQPRLLDNVWPYLEPLLETSARTPFRPAPGKAAPR